MYIHAPKGGPLQDPPPRGAAARRGAPRRPATCKHGWSKHGFSRIPSKHIQISK